MKYCLRVHEKVKKDVYIIWYAAGSMHGRVHAGGYDLNRMLRYWVDRKCWMYNIG